MTPGVGELRKLLPAIAEQFREHPDILHVGLGEKQTAGSPTGKTVIVFFVRRKVGKPSNPLPQSLDLSKLDRGHPAPTMVETDVIARRIKGHLLNAIDGADILRSTIRTDFGTLGLVLNTRDGSGRVWGITNAHVVAAPNGTSRDEVQSNSFPGSPKIGKVFQHSPLKTNDTNTMDLALIDVDERFATDPLAVQGTPQRLAGFRSISETVQGGARRRFVYISNGRSVFCKTPRLIQSGTFPHPNGRRLSFGTFYAFDVSRDSPSAPQGGDSGSLLLATIGAGGRLFGTGIVFGGGQDLVVAYSWRQIRPWIRTWVPRIRS